MKAECPVCWAQFDRKPWNRSGCCSYRCIARNAHGKLNAQDVLDMREMRAKGATYRAIAKAYGVHLSTATAVVKWA